MQAWQNFVLLSAIIWSTQAHAVHSYNFLDQVSCDIVLADSDQLSRAVYEQILIFVSGEPQIQSALKSLHAKKRTGWLRRGIPPEQAESVLQHSEKVFRAAMEFPMNGRLNRARMAWMGYFHDLAEYIVFDYTPADQISSTDKHKLERDVLEKLLLDKGGFGSLILELWNEYEQQITPESKIVMQLDKLDAGIQALEYDQLGFDVSEFFPYTEKKLTHPLLVQIFSDLTSNRRTTANFYEQYFARLKRGN